MRILFAPVPLALLLLLAGCGADGPPTPPEPGLKISGEASLGVTTQF